MNKYFAFVLITLACYTSLGVNKLDVFLLAKFEYKDLEAGNKLIDRAISNAFGTVNDDNNYKYVIKKVDCWNSEIAEFRYQPEVDVANRTKLNKSILASASNSAFKLRITFDMERCFFTNRIREYIDENSSILIDVVVVGDERIFVTEAIDKDVFNEILNTNAFVDKAFKNFFGVNVMNVNYHIETLKTTACLIKSIKKGECAEMFEIKAIDSTYNVFADKITTKEYSSGFILFDVVVSKEKSRLTQKANEVIIRDADRSEHIRFYFCVPKYNLRPGSGRFFDIEGKILTADKKPFGNVTVELRDVNNKTVATQKTDKDGYLKFDKVDEGMSYTLFIDKSYKEEDLKLSTKADKTVGTFKKTKQGSEYKLVTPVINTLEVVKLKEGSDDMTITIKARVVSVTDKINPVANQIVELRDYENKVLQTKTTNNEGDFEFSDVNIKEIYSVELFEYKEKFKNEKIYLANKKNELMARINRNSKGKFAYKTIQSDLVNLSDMESDDVSLTLNKQLRSKEKNFVIRDFVYYDLNSAAISEEGKVTLDKILVVVKENKDSKVEIISHTDSRGDANENLKLSQKRSEAVLDYFIKSGIDKARLSSVGKGESEPLNSCTDGVQCTEAEYKMNRRTEFKFTK